MTKSEREFKAFIHSLPTNGFQFFRFWRDLAFNYLCDCKLYCEFAFCNAHEWPKHNSKKKSFFGSHFSKNKMPFLLFSKFGGRFCFCVCHCHEPSGKITKQCNRRPCHCLSRPNWVLTQLGNWNPPHLGAGDEARGIAGQRPWWTWGGGVWGENLR